MFERLGSALLRRGRGLRSLPSSNAGIERSYRTLQRAAPVSHLITGKRHSHPTNPNSSLPSSSSRKMATSALQEHRKGVFFDTSEVPVTGVMANERNDAEALKETIASWQRSWEPTGPLSVADLEQFFTDGWVIVHDVVPQTVIDEAVSSVEGLVDELAQRLHRSGRIHNLHEDASFMQRLIRLEEEFPHASVLLHKNGVLPKGIQDLWSHENLVGVARQILGSDVDIMGHPVWNLRSKTPDTLSHGQATVPWHQDNSYLDEECWDKLQLTAWVPLVDTNSVNGCMEVVTKGHETGMTCNHACCVGGTWYTEVTPEELEATLGCNMEADTVVCEVPRGSVLFLNNLIPHRSLPNQSDGVRWSLDLRFQRGGEPNGFHGLKDSVLMRPGGDSWDGVVRWDEWALEDRNKAQQASLSSDQRKAVKEVGQEEGRYDPDAAFDTTIAGPWMNRWGVVHHNRHTANLDPTGGMHGWGGDQFKK